MPEDRQTEKAFTEIQQGMARHSEFCKELAELINRHSMENESDTPDWILADYIKGCMDHFNFAVNKRERWYGRES